MALDETLCTHEQVTKNTQNSKSYNSKQLPVVMYETLHVFYIKNTLISIGHCFNAYIALSWSAPLKCTPSTPSPSTSLSVCIGELPPADNR